MLPIIKIKRATGEYERQLVKMAETKFYYLVIYKNIEPIWGGLYAAALLTKQYTEVKTKNGLCLDAAIEVFNKAAKQLKQLSYPKANAVSRVIPLQTLTN